MWSIPSLHLSPKQLLISSLSVYSLFLECYISENVQYVGGNPYRWFVAYCANSELKAFVSCLIVSGSRRWEFSSFKCVTTRKIIVHCSSVAHIDTTYDEPTSFSSAYSHFLVYPRTCLLCFPGRIQTPWQLNIFMVPVPCFVRGLAQDLVQISLLNKSEDGSGVEEERSC